MSANATINSETGNHPVDPYKTQNSEDPPLPQKVQDLADFISEVKFGMLTTKQSEGEFLTSRCMALAAKEHGGIDLVFHTNLFSGKTMDLTVHPQETNMSFLDPVSGAWASISGTASIVSDPETVQKYYSPQLKAWLGDMGDGVHDGGPTDPRIGVIKLEAKLATHVVATKGILSRAVNTVKGAIKGEVPAINSIRELSLEELAESLEQRYIEKMAVAHQKKSLCRDNSHFTEIYLEQLWLEILGYPVDSLNPSDDFFHLGGTSLQVANLINRIQRSLGIELRATTLYENSSLGQLTRIVKRLEDGTAVQDPTDELNILAQDSSLGQDLQTASAPAIDWLDYAEGRVFLMGATGFVGAFLLASLLSMPHVKQLACLVRAHDESTADTRIKKMLAKYGLSGVPEDKIIAIPGDISLPGLGVSREIYDHYATWASVVFHLGALVSYVQPYSRHRATNVLGTLQLLAFANHSRPKRLVYSSSVAAYGPTGFTRGTQNVPGDERPLDHLESLQYNTGYSQSQFVAENVQRKVFAPVDFVVDAMLRISASAENEGHAYNLIQPDPIDLQETFSLISAQCARPLKGVSLSDWVCMFVNDVKSPLHPFIPLFQERVWGDRTPWEVQESAPQFEINNTIQALRKHPELLAWKPASNLLRKYVLEWSGTSNHF
ncbi:Male sterility NAD-binding [Penicillium canariense]|uniref:Male sterility NAD-binding n=1 Tax=Penicillium canariense TaxID=189055 RepID=A0A9W9I5I3_9EURO|nr:Male sterility NAD-binding [Penicillium canariense]KAJ5167158.1 Male sterility NAD-binding [Penicillium canariense]